jgi:ankyrin repeat protein
MKPIILLTAVVLFAASCHAAGNPLSKMKAEDVFSAAADIALAEAAARGQIDKLSELLGHGAEVNARGKDGMTPLFWALIQGNKEGFKYLLEHGANPNLQDAQGTSVMSVSAALKDSVFLAVALKNGGNPNLVGQKSAKTPIFSSIENMTWDNLQLLIGAGANLDFKDRTGSTPLMRAAGINQYQIVYIMLKAGADPTIKNNWGYTILFPIKNNNINPAHELYQWRSRVIELLKERGMNVD